MEGTVTVSLKELDELRDEKKRLEIRNEELEKAISKNKTIIIEHEIDSEKIYYLLDKCPSNNYGTIHYVDVIDVLNRNDIFKVKETIVNSDNA